MQELVSPWFEHQRSALCAQFRRVDSWTPFFQHLLFQLLRIFTHPLTCEHGPQSRAHWHWLLPTRGLLKMEDTTTQVDRYGVRKRAGCGLNSALASLWSRLLVFTCINHTTPLALSLSSAPGLEVVSSKTKGSSYSHGEGNDHPSEATHSLCEGTSRLSYSFKVSHKDGCIFTIK